MTDAELGAIYKRANGEDVGKAQPITTARVFKAMRAVALAARPWVRHNHLTDTYDTPDGTSVAAEVADNAQCLADVLHIATIREEQRAAIASKPQAGEQKPGAVELLGDTVVRVLGTDWPEPLAPQRFLPKGTTLYTAPVQPEQVAQDSKKGGA